MDTIFRKGNVKKHYYIYRKKLLKNKKYLDEIKKYRIPPAWKSVIITLNKNIIATGYDTKGRKQYIYSQKHIEKKRISKYCNLIDFLKIIPLIRKDIKYNLSKKKISKEKLIAILLNIIIICSFRIGSEDNRKKYNSHGISTITKKEININKNNITIDFIGKKGVQNKCKITDPKMVKLLKDLYKNTKKKDNIFIYDDLKISNVEVNNYLKSFNKNITSKVFRTWLANTKLIDKIMNSKYKLYTDKERLQLIREIKKEIASEMHHTVSVCSKSYIIKELVDLYINDSAFKKIIVNNYKKSKGLEKSENSLLYYLKKYCK